MTTLTLTPVRNADKYRATLAFLFAEVCREDWIRIHANYLVSGVGYGAEREAAREYRIHSLTAEELLVQQLRAIGHSQHDAEFLAIDA